MSEQSTSEPNVIAPGPKVKDPRRVAAGKRLAAISKQAKETKRLERESQQISETKTDNNKEKVLRTFSADKEEPEQEPTPKRENFKSVFDD